MRCTFEGAPVSRSHRRSFEVDIATRVIDIDFFGGCIGLMGSVLAFPAVSDRPVAQSCSPEGRVLVEVRGQTRLAIMWFATEAALNSRRCISSLKLSIRP